MSNASPGLTRLSELTLQRGLSAIASVVGSRWVTRLREDQTNSLDPYGVGDWRDHAACAVVMPGSVVEVQEVVRIAAQHGIALWPVSRGCNLGYGGSAPLLPGTVVVDLRRMNRIHEVDTRGGLCVIEPGVGFIDLFNYLQQNKIALWMSVPGNPTGSVLGNALERGFGCSPYGEHASKLCGLEVVLPDGEMVRTGMGAMTNSRCWHHYAPGFGPSWDSMLIQSNFGIVTRAGVWLMPEPEATLRARIALPEFGDLEWAVEALAHLRLQGLLEHPVVVGSYLHEAAVFSQRDEWYCGAGSLPPEIGHRIREHYRLGWWNFSLMLFGYGAVIRAQAALIAAMLREKLGYSLQFESWVRGEALERSAACVPSALGLQVANWCGAGGAHTCFSAVMPPDAKLALEAARQTLGRFEQSGCDYCGSFVVGGRHVTHVNTIVFDRNDVAMRGAVQSLVGALRADATARGFGEYRAHLDGMQAAAGSFDFNDFALRKLNERVKDAVDPAGILAPGKNGIWPRRYRSAADE